MYESKLRKFQRDNHIPVEDLAGILGVSKSMVYYWREFGIRRWTTAANAAKKLGCNVDDIIGMVSYED